MAPYLLIAMGADQETYRENNGYIISEQGKINNYLRFCSRYDFVQNLPEGISE